MIIGRYLQWVETAPVGARIDAARTLVEVYLSPDTDAYGQADAELALFALLDDPSAAVRRALAEAVAPLSDVPRHLVAALAMDQSIVAAPVLWHSPLLDDADLVDAVAIGDAAAQQAVALRSVVRAPVAAALAEIGAQPAVLALVGNESADILSCAMRRIVDRFAEDGEVREALLARDDLDPAMRHDLVVATVETLTAFATRCNWLSAERADRLTRETRERATVTIAAQSLRREGAAGTRLLVSHLRQRGHLTPALILRALLSGNLGMFEAALSELSGTSAMRVAGQVRSPEGLGFASLYGKAGLPAALLPVCRTALAALRETGAEDLPASAGLHRMMVIRVLDSCEGKADPALGKVAALLRRYEAEAVRDEARLIAANAWAEDAADTLPALLPLLAISPNKAPRLTFRTAA